MRPDPPAHGSCHAAWDGAELVIGDGVVERRWRRTGDGLAATSLRSVADGREWLARPSVQAAPTPWLDLPVEQRHWHFHVEKHPAGPVEDARLAAELVASGPTASLAMRFVVYPDCGAVQMTMAVLDGPHDRWTDPTPPTGSARNDRREDSAAASGVETEAPPDAQVPRLDLLELLDWRPPHLRLTQVVLRDRTDLHNELVFENQWLLHPNEHALRLQGNVFVLEDPLTQSGWVFLKLAPLPHARPVPTAFDCFVDERPNLYYEAEPSAQFGPCHARWPLAYRVGFVGHGATGFAAGYSWAMLHFAGGPDGCTGVLHALQRRLRRYESGRDGLFVSNTWGDRNRDARINSEFIGREIDAAARLGVDVVQIDDGWQQGTTANSAEAQARGGVWEGFHRADPQFWKPSESRFPDGLEPLIASARERGLRFGLWFAPDSSDDFANWQRDVDAILSLHRGLGVDYFKIDGVRAESKLAEHRLARFFSDCLAGSQGRIVFDLDVTAQVRPGYFGAVGVGPIFLENRYSDYHRWWPHQTLRNLWKLSRWVDPARLRIELLNPERHAALYAGDPLAPANWPPDALYAIAMAASPLGWFETSGLSGRFIDAVSPLVRTWREHRDAWFGGRITPIGEVPDGTTWTGFLSRSPTGAYAIVFRELSPEPTWPLPTGVPGRPSVLYGEASIEPDRIRIERPLAFALVTWT